MRLAFQRQDRNPQSSFVKPAGARAVKRVIVARAATNVLALLQADRSRSKQPALPAQSVVFAEQLSCVPAVTAGDAVMTRLNAVAADGARLRIDEREGGVVKLAGKRCTQHQHNDPRNHPN